MISERPLHAGAQEGPIAVAVSGGVDSLCALLLLKRQGLSVFAIHGLFQNDSKSETFCAPLQFACRKLGIPLRILDLSSKFEELVIEKTAASLAKGETPNPCALCNRDIKFGLMLKNAEELGAARLATGHYVNLERNPYVQGKLILGRAKDELKDQAYFLSLTPRKVLEKALFPLGMMTKNEARQLVNEAGFVIATGESQDLCFAEKGLPELAKKVGITGEPGTMRLKTEEGEKELLSRHQGLFRYTIGQRRGLNMPYSEPLHVLAKNFTDNSLIIGPARFCRMKGCTASDCNFYAPFAKWPGRLFCRLRYGQTPLACSIEAQGKMLFVQLEKEVFPTAPGQICAVLDEAGRTLAGGVIEKILQTGL